MKYRGTREHILLLEEYRLTLYDRLSSMICGRQLNDGTVISSAYMNTSGVTTFTLSPLSFSKNNISINALLTSTDLVVPLSNSTINFCMYYIEIEEYYNQLHKDFIAMHNDRSIVDMRLSGVRVHIMGFDIDPDDEFYNIIRYYGSWENDRNVVEFFSKTDKFDLIILDEGE